MFDTLVSLVQKNRYFFIPFLIWIISGGLLLSLYSKDQLFLTVNGAHNPVLDVIVTGTTYLGDGITYAAMLLLFLIARKWRTFLIAGSTLLAVTLVVQSVKHFLNAPRPLSYYADASIVHVVPWVHVHGSCSFPSGHTSSAFGMFCFLALWSNNKMLGAVLFVLGLATAHSRLYLAQHFFEDVYVGSIIGTLFAMLIYTGFELRKNRTPAAVRAHDPAINPLVEVA